MTLNLYISYHYTRQLLNARSIRKIIIKAQRFRASALSLLYITFLPIIANIQSTWQMLTDP